MALARWRDSALVNTYGEVFQAASNEALPVFVGPDGTARRGRRDATRRSRRTLGAARQAPDARCVLSPRAPGSLTLGRRRRSWSSAASRWTSACERFVAAYPRTLAQLPATRLAHRPALPQRLRRARAKLRAASDG